ncbi:MAG: hypothetical protein Q9190_002031 [Brigantiaea leucoxantha]
MTKRSLARTGGTATDRAGNNSSPLSHLSKGSSAHVASKGNERDARRHQALLEQREVSELRSRVTRSRLGLRELRVELRQRHSTIRELQARFMKLLRQDWAHHERFDRTVYEALYEDICAALDELGPSEEDYEEKEDELDGLDFELETKETRFYERFQNTELEGSNRDDVSIASSQSSDSFTAHSRPLFFDPYQFQPQFQGSHSHYLGDESSLEYQYLSRYGDAKIVRERLSELENEKEQYDELGQNRESLGIPPYSPNVEFLRSYSEIKLEHIHELKKIEDELHSMELEARLDNNALNAAKPFVRIEHSTMEMLPAPRSTVSDRPALNVPKPASSFRRKSEGDVETALSSRERINEWLLARFDGSLIEKAVYKAINDPKLDDSEYWKLVREYWSKDLAAISPPTVSNAGSQISDVTNNGDAERPSESTIVTDLAPYIPRFQPNDVPGDESRSSIDEPIREWSPSVGLRSSHSSSPALDSAAESQHEKRQNYTHSL